MAQLPELGAYIKVLRGQHNLTLKDLAERIDMSVSYMSDIERGKTNPALDTLHAIAGVFGMSLTEFFGGTANGLSAEEHELIRLYRQESLYDLISFLVKESKFKPTDENGAHE